MKRYHEEKHIIESRVQMYKRLGGYLGPQHDKFVPDVGRFRKTWRCSGCRQSRCYVCHSDKFPKRKPTRQEQQADKNLSNTE
jgi:hypothetical protein